MRGILPKYRHARRGFTMVEATISLALLLMGLLGMGAIAAATIRSNLEAQDRTRANNLADRMVEMIYTESLGWNDGTWAPAAETPEADEYFALMSELPPAVQGGSGFQEITKVLQGSNHGFDVNLNPVDLGDDDAGARTKYCVHYNITWLNPNETVRADVRVYWMRRGSSPRTLFGNTCGDDAANIVALGRNRENVHMVGRSVFLVRNNAGDV